MFSPGVLEPDMFLVCSKHTGLASIFVFSKIYMETRILPRKARVARLRCKKIPPGVFYKDSSEKLGSFCCVGGFSPPIDGSSLFCNFM